MGTRERKTIDAQRHTTRELSLPRGDVLRSVQRSGSHANRQDRVLHGDADHPVAPPRGIPS